MESTLIRSNQYNIGHICTRQQCDNGLGEKVAMRWLSSTLEATNYTFNDLELQSNRFANLLIGLGLAPGDVVFTLLPKQPEQFFAFLGSLKVQAITAPLFSNFGEEALLDRLGDAQAKAIITKKSFLKKLAKIRPQLPALKHIIVVDIDEHLEVDILSYRLLMAAASDEFTSEFTAPEVPSVLHYTSGSTGKPKGVLHGHRSVLSQSATSKNILGLGADDIFWCTADQGWVTGTSYGIIGPWSLGVTQVHYAGGYDATAWFSILEREGVNIWYTAPTALRMLMREVPSLFHKFNLRNLRHVFSVGEPLNPEVIYWARKTLDKEVYDTWFQTETGAIMISNQPGLDVRPGSMGKPCAGVEAAILTSEATLSADGEQGDLCLKTGWPSMFVTYLNNQSVYQEKFKGGYYYSGDAAYKDEDGYFWFMGRSDDVINTAGHLVSPFEVESALLEIEAVAESAAVGIPDELLFEKVVVFICLHSGYQPSEDLGLKIRLHIANKVSSIATPQEVIFVDNIPKNKSGKIMRRVLKAKHMGADTGDISTLEI